MFENQAKIAFMSTTSYLFHYGESAPGDARHAFWEISKRAYEFVLFCDVFVDDLLQFAGIFELLDCLVDIGKQRVVVL